MIKKYVKFQKKEEERQEKQGRLFIKGLQMKVETVGEVAVNHGYDQQKGCFESASVVLPVINEVRSLQQTVDILFEYTEESIREVIIVVCDKTTSESLFVCNELRKRYTGKIRIIWQVLPFLGGALREGLISATGSHVIVMFSDGESDPRTVGDLVMMAKGHPDEIISASRWLKRNSFEGYPALKTFLNYFFQKAFALLFGKNITDFSFGYRIYPKQLIREIQWEETGHSFVLESILKPLCLNIKVIEIPSSWKARSEGKSQLKIHMYLRYLWVGLKVKITPNRYFIKLKTSNKIGVLAKQRTAHQIKGKGISFVDRAKTGLLKDPPPLTHLTSPSE